MAVIVEESFDPIVAFALFEKDNEAIKLPLLINDKK